MFGELSIWPSSPTINNEGMNHLQTDPHLLLRTMVQTNDSLLALECRARWGRNPFLNLAARVGLRSRLKRAARFGLRRTKTVTPWRA